MNSADLVRLRRMLEASREAVAFGSAHSPDDLRADRIRALALVRCIEIVGEAASKIARETRSTLSALPWADIVGMRNRLIHAYFDVDLARVCDTISSDLPPLIAMLDANPQRRGAVIADTGIKNKALRQDSVLGASLFVIPRAR